MLWVALALLTAFTVATRDLFIKKSLKNVDEYVTAWAMPTFSLPILLIALLYTGVPQLDRTFFYALSFQAVALSVTTIFYVKALKLSPLSLVLPMLAFTPAFLLITSPLILGEFPTFMGIIGIMLIVLGSYVLKIEKINGGLLEPFRALLKEKGAVLMLSVAFIWSITANIDKMAILHSSPIFYIFSIELLLSIILFVVMKKKSRTTHKIKGNLKNLFYLGFFFAIALISWSHAMKIAIVPYVVSIKRTSILIASIYGFILFKETHIKKRLGGAVIMVIGAILISLS